MNHSILLPIITFLPVGGAFVTYLTGRKSKTARNIVADLFCAADLVLAAFLFFRVFQGETLSFTIPFVCVRGLYFTMDGFRSLYVLIACWMWFVTTVFSGDYLARYRSRNRYYLFVMITFGATVGMFLADDLFTAYIFFEIMSLSSYVMVAQEETKGALRAGETYLGVAVIGGMVMLMGLFLLENAVGTLNISALAYWCSQYKDRVMLYAAGACLLVGFGAKAGMFPLHIWLPKAHPVAPAPASALLSGILTKCGVFGILITGNYILYHDEKWGRLILFLGVVTMVIGAVLAVFSVDLKRTLACSSMSQIGFILVGAGFMQLLGEENALAARGAFLHMVNHSLLKLVLFVTAGVVYMNVHRLNLNDVRGFGRKKPFLHFAFLMGVLGITGVPGWNGYVSKTLLHESIVEYAHHAAATGGSAGIYTAVEWIFLISGGLTCAYMLKLYICLFWEKNTQMQEHYDEMKKYMHPVSRIVLGLSALILPVLGFGASVITDRIADLGQPFLRSALPEHAVAYFSWENLKGGLISLGIGAAVYLLVIRTLLMVRTEQGGKIYADRWPAKLDLENLIYRPLVLTVLPMIGAFFSRILDKLLDTIIFVGLKTVFKERRKPPKYTMFSFMRFNSRETSVQREILGSFSFSLLLFALGLSAVLIYLVLV